MIDPAAARRGRWGRRTAAELLSVRPRAAALLSLLLLAAASTRARAEPTIWDKARDPQLARVEPLLELAERSRLPAPTMLAELSFRSRETDESLRRSLNARAAAIIEVAGGAELGDPRLVYLLGDAMVQAEGRWLDEGTRRLREALRAAPESPLAAEAWFRLGVAEGKSGNRHEEGEAYTQALALEWQPELQATILMNRAESAMARGELAEARADYRASLELSRSGLTRALATWGLAVATERDGDLPTALALARAAASRRFGRRGATVAIDAVGVYFSPDYEVHYYRALATMAEAEQEPSPRAARRLIQTAMLLWSLYLEEGTRSGGAPWASHARAHRRWCRERADTLATAAGRVKTED